MPQSKPKSSKRKRSSAIPGHGGRRTLQRGSPRIRRIRQGCHGCNALTSYHACCPPLPPNTFPPRRILTRSQPQHLPNSAAKASQLLHRCQIIPGRHAHRTTDRRPMRTGQHVQVRPRSVQYKPRTTTPKAAWQQLQEQGQPSFSLGGFVLGTGKSYGTSY